MLFYRNCILRFGSIREHCFTIIELQAHLGELILLFTGHESRNCWRIRPGNRLPRPGTSSTRSSFPAVCAKPVPLAGSKTWVKLDSSAIQMGRSWNTHNFLMLQDIFMLFAAAAASKTALPHVRDRNAAADGCGGSYCHTNGTKLKHPWLLNASRYLHALGCGGCVHYRATSRTWQAAAAAVDGCGGGDFQTNGTELKYPIHSFSIASRSALRRLLRPRQDTSCTWQTAAADGCGGSDCHTNGTNLK